MSTALAHSAPAAEVVWEQLGTTIVLRVTDRETLGVARAATRAELDAIDLACSRFRADSELSRLNAAAGRPTLVSDLLADAIAVALRAAALTDGAVDPTIGRAIEICGYDRDWPLLDRGLDAGVRAEVRAEIPAGVRTGLGAGVRAGAGAAAPVLVGRAHGDWRAIRVDQAGTLVSVPAPIKLDLGATAKAWAADRAARAAADAAGCGVLVAVGGDLAVEGPPPAQGWPVLVTDDHRASPSATGQRVNVAEGGLATSSVTVRRWRRGAREMHHIIDPASGAPAESPWRTVSVAAASCTDANIAATAAIVKGEAAIEWLEASGLPSRLVSTAGSVVCLNGWPAEQAEATA